MGQAPVRGSGCGVAGGGADRYANGGNAPYGIAQNTDGYSGLPQQPHTIYQIGSAIDVAWAISANHGGGYHYRLCKVSDGVSEECFQKTPLKISGTNSYILHANGTVATEFPRRLVTEGTNPPGSEWAMDPIPGCKTCEDARETCGAPLDPIPQDQPGGLSSDAWDTQVTCYGLCAGAGSSKEHGVCDPGTEFYEPLSGHSGFGKNVPDWSMMDKVLIPADLEEGEYMLGWRWDCEESNQIWQNCADIVLTKDAPPSTTVPAPSPPPAQTCSGFMPDAATYACYYAGCKTGESTACEECCEGCHLESGAKGAYCMEDTSMAV